jgi:hypothetical protein
MSALRHERKRVCPMSALHPKAHIVERDRDVSFVPQADILRRGKQSSMHSIRCLLYPTSCQPWSSEVIAITGWRFGLTGTGYPIELRSPFRAPATNRAGGKRLSSLKSN